MTKLARRGKAAIFDGDDYRLFGVERGADLPSVRMAQPGASRAARDEAAIQEA